MEINEPLARKVLETVDVGLCSGVGSPIPGQMCVEAAVCFALGLPHGDNPPCVHPAVRSAKIALNDSTWSSNAARAAGMRRVAIAQLGSTEIDIGRFRQIVQLETIRQIVPMPLRKVGLTDHAVACESATDLSEAIEACQKAWDAAYAAYAAAADAADAAAYAAYAARSVGTDEPLVRFAEIMTQALIECGSEGSKFLYLTE